MERNKGRARVDRAEPEGPQRRLRALNSRTRREILALVWDRELAAGQIAAEFELTAATISEHLAVLRAAGLVEMTKVGTSRRYRVIPTALAGLHGALDGATKWEPATDIPEVALADVATRPAVVASVTVAVDPERTFAAFTDADTFSRWLQVPVTLQDRRFAATMEWGTEIRGHYEVVAAPHLIAMAWDFEDNNVPVPGRSLTSYLRVSPGPDGTKVTVHQLVDSPAQAAFMEAAWGVVLGRLRTNLPRATESPQTPAVPRRSPRHKRTD